MRRNDAVREQIMPITRKWNIAELLEAVQDDSAGQAGVGDV